MIKILKNIFIYLFILFCISKYSYAIDKNVAVKYIENVGQQAINILKTPIEDLQTRELLFEKMLNNHFDRKLIHRAVLGKASKGASESELIRFGKAFDKHIVKVYASQLGVYSNQLFIIDKAFKKGKKDTIVSSHIEHETAPPLRIDWRLRDRGEGTKIIDIAIEGVSLLATKRADFGASIKKGGLHSLIIDLETKNAENK
ncbi:MAG: ABC transporter substrate-binding protein [Alphaproteobacteria bacterium]|jgi:phospholipid transport system substrate-binding protein|nr:ABC transporter substrate-binding protein [Alphaproteobacteria bacterium]